MRTYFFCYSNTNSTGTPTLQHRHSDEKRKRSIKSVSSFTGIESSVAVANFGLFLCFRQGQHEDAAKSSQAASLVRPCFWALRSTPCPYTTDLIKTPNKFTLKY